MTGKIDPPRLDVEPARQSRWSSLSLVWIVPLLAVLVTVAVAWRTYADRGELIEIRFAEASGIRVGETVLKFREVDVGRVEAITFSRDLTQVIVAVRINKDVAPFVDADSRFWLVQPELTTSGISRLDTVLSGAFIEGLWDSAIGVPADTFTALEAEPLSQAPGSGTWIKLRSIDGGTLAEGAPVIFRGIKAGQLRNVRPDPESSGVIVDAFIIAPFDQRLTTASVFWDISGFSVSLGPQGLKLNVRSLASVIQGGVEFTTLVSGGQPVTTGTEFVVYEDEATARNSLFSSRFQEPLQLSILLNGSIRNLAVGSAVQFRGLTVGEITSLSVRADETPNGELVFRQQVDLGISIERMGLPGSMDETDALAFLQEQVAEGLRARVTSTGLLGNSLIVELIEVPDAVPEAIAMDAKPFPLLPTIPPDITDLSTASNQLLSRIQDLPVEELLRSATNTFDAVSAFVTKDETQDAPGAVVGLVDDLRSFVGSEDMQAVPGALRGTLDEAETFIAKLNKEEAIAQLMTAIDAVSSTAGTVSDAAKGVPDLVASLDTLAKKANDLALQELVASATKTADEISALVGSEDMAGLPGSLRETLGQASRMLDDLRNGESITNLNEALKAARSAATSLETASQNLPGLVERLDGAIAKIDEVAGSYAPASAFGRDARETVRELRNAASAIGALARKIERNPRAFLFGN